MGNDIGIFLAGVAVGAVLVAVVFRGFFGVSSVGTNAKGRASSGRDSIQTGRGGMLIPPGRHGVVTTTTTHLALAVKLPESTIHLNDGQARVEVGGATYHRLADVPTEAKMRLVEELGRALDSGTLPEPARAALEAFLAGGGAMAGQPPAPKPSAGDPPAPEPPAGEPPAPEPPAGEPPAPEPPAGEPPAPEPPAGV